MWNVTNEWHLFRDAEWVEKMGTFLKAADPYDRLTSCPGRGDFPWMASPWADFAMYQIWDEHGGYKAMLERRRKQAATGRPMPQGNEEYGYEDHYPQGWGENPKPPARSADNRRRLAWEMCMAGGYQTTGERADRGTGWGPDTGGGWVNGRGDDTMTMLAGYGHIVDFFSSIPYWRLEPVPEIVEGNALCLAETDKRYVVYLPDGGTAQLALAAGTHRARLFNPRDGQWRSASTVTVPDGQPWTTPRVPEDGDWVLLLERQ